MRNPPGRHLLRVATRAVRSSSALGSGGGGGASTSATSPVAASSSSGGRPRTRSAGRLLRATSPPPPSAIAAAACWESRTMRREGEEEWEEVVAGAEQAIQGAPVPVAEEEEEYRVVFWSPPTGDEVRAAFTSIEEVFGDPFRAHSYETEEQSALSTSVHSSSGNSSGSDDWIEPAAYALNSTALLTREHRNVLDAFRLLQKDPNVQKMVMSLSCDRAVWDAVMNNEAVQEFRRSFQDEKETAGKKGNPGGPAGVLKWILGNTQAKLMEFMNNIMKIVNMLFHSDDDEAKPDLYTDAVKVSFMLSVFIFIVVAIARIK
uniref:Uncharacterized protein n=1 Tax=Oryza meridionalis TaxID=40149 RepID=A0A0E0CPB3_9ORYZ